MIWAQRVAGVVLSLSFYLYLDHGGDDDDDADDDGGEYDNAKGSHPTQKCSFV